jgi:hypothetical protein
MALSQSDLDRLDIAIAGAELEVTIDGKSVKYRSIEELKAARDHVQAVIAKSVGTPRRAAYRFTFSTHRGE